MPKSQRRAPLPNVIVPLLPFARLLLETPDARSSSFELEPEFQRCVDSDHSWRSFIMASRSVTNAFFAWTWSPVLAGVFASLVVQILLTMLGFGIGLLALDTPTAASAPTGAGWAAFVWWAVSGIIAAFIGGAIAAANSPDQSGLGRVGHALGAWAVATVVVVAAAAIVPA